MWAQLMKIRLADGSFDRLQELGHRWEDQVGRGTNSGWVRTLILRTADDPNELYELVYFDSEEKARANEQSQKHQELIRQMMPLFEGEPEYVDLKPIQESQR